MTVEGDYKQSIKLIEQNFDHIFFTGSTETGKSIMKLASKNLTPLTPVSYTHLTLPTIAKV